MKTKTKTHKASVKRFKQTGTGKLQHKKQGKNSHKWTLGSKSKKRLKTTDDLKTKKEVKKITKLMGK